MIIIIVDFKRLLAQLTALDFKVHALSKKTKSF